MTYSDVLALLTKLQPDGFGVLLNQLESLHLEFKAQPYMLKTLAQKQELAKDVCALANAEGGCILLGVKAIKSVIHPSDEASEIRTFRQGLLKIDQCHHLLRDWIYPVPLGIEIKWYADPSKADHGLAAIMIPPQESSRMPFLVQRTVAEGKADGVIFGMFQRRRADAEHLSVQEVQSIMRDGLILKQVIDARRAEPINETATTVQSPTTVTLVDPPGGISEETRQRAARLVTDVKLEAAPTYVLTARPNPTIDASGMFESNTHPIVELLKHPPEIRASGFDMDSGEPPQIQRGLSRRSAFTNYKGLEFWRDGTLVFVASGGQGFLSWGDRTPDSPFYLNPVVVVESIYLFCRLFWDLTLACKAAPAEVIYSIHLVRMCIDGQPPRLWPGNVERYLFRSDAKSGPECDAELVTSLPGSLEPAAAAYSLLGSLYAWFGLEYSAIPFVLRDGTPPVVDPAQIAAL